MSACRESRNRPGYRLPIAALTANGNEQVAQQCQEAGTDLFLNKPFRITDVQAILSLMDEAAAAAAAGK